MKKVKTGFLGNGFLEKKYKQKIKSGQKFCYKNSKFIKKDFVLQLIETVLFSGDRVCLEGNNQKQADFFAKELTKLNPKKVNNLHLVQSSIVLPEHIQILKSGIVSKIDFSYSGPQAKPLAEIIKSRKVELGAIHTYIELYARYFIDLTPNVSFIVAESADKEGNLFFGNNSEDTPVIVEATKSKFGIVVAQVCKIVNKLPRVDIPKDYVDFIIETGEKYYIQPLFTRDPAKITKEQIFMAMLVLKGIYLPYKVKTLNHGIGNATAAIELILPTYGKKLGLKGKYATHWVLNPHPTLIPAIEEGFVKNIYSFGGEPGMEDYIKFRKEIFCVGQDGTLKSNRLYAHLAGLYGIDMFIGSTLQIDQFGNSSAATFGRIAGFGGAPNLGSTPPGRRHLSESFSMCKDKKVRYSLGRKLVVQITPTITSKGIPVFVEELDAVKFYKEKILPYVPIMIYSDQITHLVTEQGIACLYKCDTEQERQLAVSSVAGDTVVGKKVSLQEKTFLRQKGIFISPQDLGIKFDDATENLLSAKSFDELVKISKGHYHPVVVSD
ncbi:MAG: malonate decarboxylase subunit alpha [Endomicrobiia bacterium]